MSFSDKVRQKISGAIAANVPMVCVIESADGFLEVISHGEHGSAFKSIGMLSVAQNIATNAIGNAQRCELGEDRESAN